MECELCEEKNRGRIIVENESAFALICKWPLKNSHIIVLPKRHIEKLSDFTNKESKDFFNLCDIVVASVKKMCDNDEDPILFQNYGRHSSQPHLHFHIIASKGHLRQFMNKYEDIPLRELKSDEEMMGLKEEFKKFL